MLNKTQENIVKYNDAVQTIKTAILQGQYEAVKGVNRIQLAVYFAIGKYISINTRKKVWGTHALEFISEQLRRELPGLRGFSETQMREMRLFYEGWIMLDSNSSVATDELQSLKNECVTNSSVATDELIDVYHAITIADVNFPMEDFFQVPFTHHSYILSSVKEVQARYYYIHRTAEEHLAVSKLKKIIRDDAFGHQGKLPSNFTNTIRLVVIELKMGKFKTSYLGQLFGYLQILDDKMRKPHENSSIGIVLCQEADRAYAEYAVRDYSKPMGVATYKTLDDMPEPLRNALPDMKEAMKLIGKKK